uniref:MRG domain-containing protein n=1 Tax=Syphacia muris TaxID=451379 RepID=A0A158R4W6_9BILA
MPKKEGTTNRDAKEKSDKSAKKDTNGVGSKGKEKESSKDTSKKEATAGRDSTKSDNDLHAKEGKSLQLAYELNSKVLCKHRDSLYYEAKVIAIDDIPDRGRVYTVHYQGWNSRHDEKIPEIDAAERFLPCTEENLEMARAEMQEARLMEKKRKGKKSTTLAEEKKASGLDSRGGTPSEKVLNRLAGTPSAEKGTPTSSNVGRKRKLANAEAESIPVDNFGAPKPEIKIEIPDSLKDILVDDQDMIVRQMNLVKLPARTTVEDIIKQYAECGGFAMNDEDEVNIEQSGTQFKMTKETVIESSHGIQDYFNTTLGSQLLYKFERPQYADLFKRKNEEINTVKSEDKTGSGNGGDLSKQKWHPSDTYGFIHLLRLFVKFGTMLRLTNWSDKAIKTVVSHVQDFLAYLEKNRQKFYDIEKDYIVASPEYQKSVWNA